MLQGWLLLCQKIGWQGGFHPQSVPPARIRAEALLVLPFSPRSLHVTPRKAFKRDGYDNIQVMVIMAIQYLGCFITITRVMYYYHHCFTAVGVFRRPPRQSHLGFSNIDSRGII